MEQPGSPRREIVEIRVHGVHGTSPAAMLGVEASDVRQVAGDNLTGLYRSKSGELPYRTLGRSSISVEAYSWGALTSGARGLLGWLQRALWLLLLPFALANLAYWARLSLDGSRLATRVGARFTRLGALLLTAFMVLFPSLIAIDLVAWQCYRGDSPGCTPLPGFLNFMADLRAGQRMAVASLVPLLVIALLWFLSRQSLARYEEVTPDAQHDVPEGVTGGSRRAGASASSQPLVLRHQRLWQGKQRTRQLQRAHLTVALATVVAFSGVHAVVTPGGSRPMLVVVLVLTGLVVVTTVTWALALHPDDVESDRAPASRVARRMDRIVDDPPAALLGAMIAVSVVHAWALWRLPGSLEQDADFVGHNLWFIGIFVVLTVVHLVVFTIERMTSPWGTAAVVGVVVLLALAGLAAHLDLPLLGSATGWALAVLVLLFFAALGFWHQRCGRQPQRRAQAWSGAAPSVFLAAAGWVMLLFTTGGVMATANYLNGDEHGVDDLVSTLADDRSSTAVAGVAPEAEPEPEPDRVLRVEGDVVARNAVITLGAPEERRPVLRAGTIVAERIYDVAPDSMESLNGVALQKGRVRIAEGVIKLESTVLRLEDSCVRLYNTDPCSPESSRYFVGGQLKLPTVRLQVCAGDGDTCVDGAGVELVPTEPPAVPLVVPQVLIWAPLAQTLWLLATALWASLAYRFFKAKAGTAIEDQVVSDGIPPRDRAACVKARLTAGFAHRAERIVDVVGSITSVLVIGLIVASATGEAPWVHLEWLRPFATAGMYVALGTGLALLLLASRVRTSEDTRRAVGVLWDLTTFWPRAAHPLAPPCYAERVVPELRHRADWVLHQRHPEQAAPGPDPRRNNLLVLSGHSQGSVIVCALLARLPAEDLARTRVITYGSQIRALYGRVFPAVFGPGQIGYVPTVPPKLGDPFPDAPDHQSEPPQAGAFLSEHVTRTSQLLGRLRSAGCLWINLFRRSDPLGYRVFGDHDDEPAREGDPVPEHPRDLYVPEVPDVIVGDAGPRVNTHGGYQHTFRYRAEVAVWTGETAEKEPPSTVDLPALPG